jgi:hypothetical protein
VKIVVLRAIAPLVWLCMAVLYAGAAFAAEPAFDGRKKCSSCHRSQYESWAKTAHAKALDSLKPNAKAAAKKKAKLDPAKDYTADKDCVGCHTTGYGLDGGYDVKDPGKYLIGVGCESCHGPGGDYRLMHRKAGEAFERKKTTAPRQTLADAGQEFQFVERCNACHLNYERSGWKGAKVPYTPFTPAIDPKYAFSFDKAVRNDKAMHAHFKLEGTFTGPPLAKFHEEFQATAKPGAKGKEE